MAALRACMATASSLSRQIHRKGYRINFAIRPRLVTPEEAVRYAAPEDNMLHKKWEELIKKGQAEVIRDNSPGFYSRSFTIPKKKRGERRLISDLRQLNKHVIHKKIKTPGLASAMHMISANDLMAVVDIQDGYFNVPIHPDHRKYFRFCVGTTLYQLNRLPMGFVGSSDAFQAWLKPHMEAIRVLHPEVKVFSYVDDCLLILPWQPMYKAGRILRSIHDCLRHMGVPVKSQKCSHAWARRVVYLGFELCSRTLSIAIPRAKAKAVQKQIRQTLRRQETKRLRLRHIATTIGMIIALLPAVPHARLHAPALYRLQNELVNSAGWHKNPKASLNDRNTAELQFWMSYLREVRRQKLPQAFHPYEVSLCASDASDNHIAAVLLTERSMPVTSRALTRRERTLPINTKELLAAILAVKSFHIPRGMLNFRIDNKAVVSGINKWTTKSATMRPLLKWLFNWGLENGVRMTATYIHTSCNVIADKLTRGKDITDTDRAEMTLLRHSYRLSRRRARWLMHHKARKDLLRVYRLRPRFAWLTPLSRDDDLIPAGFEPLFRPGDKRKTLYAFPNPGQIQHVLNIIRAHKVTALVTVPCWPGAPWFHQLASLQCSMAVIQPPAAVRPWNQRKPSSPRWAWVSVMLSGKRKVRTGFRQRLASPDAFRRGPKSDTILGGEGSETWCERAHVFCKRLRTISRRLKY